MNSGRACVICWLLFLVAAFGVSAGLQGGEDGTVLVASIAVAALSFVDAMYLGLIAIRKGDPWLRRRGAIGTAKILAAKQTNWAMAAGEYYGVGAPYIWKYGLEVTTRGRDSYRSTLYVCARLGESGTIPVRVSRLNRKRVAFDPEAPAFHSSTRKETH